MVKDIYQIIMDSYDVKEKCYKLIIWVGAGIDNDEPTGLPLGNTLTEFMIINSMPDHLLKCYYHCQSKKKKLLAKMHRQLLKHIEFLKIYLKFFNTSKGYERCLLTSI